MSGPYFDMEPITVPDILNEDEIIISSDNKVGRRSTHPVRINLTDIKSRRFNLIDRNFGSGNNDI
jgi:hypothetical protein